MPVKLRENPKANGTRSLYLDIIHNGKRYKEYLGINLKPARTPDDRAQNKALKETAIKIRVQRELELINQEYQITAQQKKVKYFLEYYDQFVQGYKNRDYRITKYSFEWWKKYSDSQGFASLKMKELSPEHCRGYADFMLSGGLKGETPYNYFGKFKMVLNRAVKENLIIKSPASDIRVVKSGGLKKDILSLTEIQQLAGARCPNPEVKRAFLFSLYTGVRWCDVKELTHRNIDRAGNTLQFTQSKTEHSSGNSQVTTPLNSTLLKLIGTGQHNEKIFNLPSHTGALKALGVWVKAAGIEKHITWHSGRHSFAVNLLGDAKADIKTVADLLGHSDLKHTQKYLHTVSERKKAAMSNLPELEF